MSRAVEYHDALSATWSAKYTGRAFGARRVLFRSLLDGVVTRGSRWLDLGCGSGIITADLVERGASVVAVDGSGPMLAHARRSLLNAAADAVEFIQSDVQALPMFADGQFDGIVCSSVVEYLDAPKAMLAEAARVLRDGGTLVISVPWRGSAVRTVQKSMRGAGRLLGRNLYAYLDVSRWELTDREFGAWLDEAGFTTQQFTGFDPLLPSALQAVLRPSLLVTVARRSVRA